MSVDRLTRSITTAPEKRVLIIYAVLLAMVMGAALYALRVTHELLETQQALFRITDTLIALDLYVDAMEDAEDGQRGFLITGDASYLQSYAAAVAGMAGNQERLRSLIGSDDPRAESQLNELERQCQHKLSELARTIALRRSEVFDAARTAALSSAGKRDMDRIRAVSSQMADQFLAERSSLRVDAGERVTRLTATELALLAAVSVVALATLVILLRITKDKQRLLEQLEHRAHYDELTQLPNRTMLRDFMSFTVHNASRTHGRFAVLMMDLDGFKEVNDRFGHHTGDQVLVEAARRFSACLRQGDVISRLGGDEFAVLLPALADTQDAAKLAQRLAECFDAPVLPDVPDCRIGVSVGIALYPGDGEDPDQLLQAADRAMYLAKRDRAAQRYRFHGWSHEQEGS